MGKTLTAISLFSGCGGFDWGASRAGLKILWANDIDKTAASAYCSLFPGVDFHLGDIRNVCSFPASDILIGCYPCTGFSVAARRRWRGDIANGVEKRDLTKCKGNFLYLEFMRVLNETHPKYFFVENVRGMLSASNGWFFNEQIHGFKTAGYKVKFNLLKAADFGAAQARQRIFIVGVRSDIAQQYSYTFPSPTHGPGALMPYNTMRKSIGDLPLWPEGEFCNAPFHGHYLTRNRKRPWDSISYTIVADADHVPLHPGGLPMKKTGKDAWALQGTFNRRLSWRECARLQGLPDHIAPQGSLDEKYKVIGNAVPPFLGEAIVAPIVKYELGL